MPLSRYSGRTYPENELTRNLSGNNRPQSSQLAEPLWTDPGLKSGISVCELISTFKKQKKRGAQARNELTNILPKSSHARKKPPPPPPQSTVAQGAETTVAECSLTSCVLARFRIGSHTMPGRKHSQPTPTSLGYGCMHLEV